MTPPLLAPRRGVTLIELTVVISMIILLVSTLFIGAKYYKDGASRSACLTNLTNIQKAIRSYQNFTPEATTVTFSHLVGDDKALAIEPTCPLNGGSYQLSGTLLSSGQAMVYCVQYDGEKGTIDSSQKHNPDSTQSW